MKKNILFIFMLFLGITLIINKVDAMEKKGKTYLNDSGVVMTIEQIHNLKSLGFNEFDINNMNQETFDANKELKGKVVARTTKYYKTEEIIINDANSITSLYSTTPTLSRTIEVSEDEYENSNNSISTLGLTTNVVNTEYKRMEATIVKINDRYRYRNTVIWKKLPVYQQVDIIGIGFDEKVYGVQTTRNFQAYYTYNATCGENVTTNGIWKLSSTGYALAFEYPQITREPDNNSGFYTDLYFEVGKNTTTKIDVLNAYGSYRHGKGLLKGSDMSGSFSVGAYGIGLSVNLEPKFDNISTSQATLTGISW